MDSLLKWTIFKKNPNFEYDSDFLRFKNVGYNPGHLYCNILAPSQLLIMELELLQTLKGELFNYTLEWVKA